MVPETMIDGIEHLFELQALLHSGAYAVSGGRARIAGLSSSRLCTTTVTASTAIAAATRTLRPPYCGRA